MECIGTRYKSDLYATYGGDKICRRLRCDVLDCPNPWTHSRNAHQCRHCNEKRHGMSECRKLNLDVKCPLCRENVTIKRSQKPVYGLDKECCICMENKPLVYFPCGHVCICKECCNNMESNIPIISIDLMHELFNIIQIATPVEISKLKDNFNTTSGKIYTVINNIDGSTWFVRRNDIDTPVQKFLMRPDEWGQHGPDHDDRALMNLFIEGYAQICSNVEIV